MEVGDDPLKTLIVLPPLGSSGFRSFLHQHLRHLHVGDILLFLETFQELPYRRVGTGEHGVTPVVPPLCYITGSWKEEGSGVMLVPSVVAEDRIPEGGSNPGVVHKGRHVRRE